MKDPSDKNHVDMTGSMCDENGTNPDDMVTIPNGEAVDEERVHDLEKESALNQQYSRKDPLDSTTNIDMTGSMYDGNGITDSDMVVVPNGEAWEEEKVHGAQNVFALKRQNARYPADCYAFLSIHSPFEKPFFWFVGMTVWIFQITFLIIVVLRFASYKLSQNEDLDNPDKDFLARFIPSNLSGLSRTIQFMALLSYCIFADESLKDIAVAVETFPTYSKLKPGDKYGRMAFSCAARFSQGFLATIVVLLLCITSSDIVEIILNFTAVNFISAFDDVAFELAQNGKYGPKVKREAQRIEELPLPDCMYRKYDHVRYLSTVLPIAGVLIMTLASVAYGQMAESIWFTQRLRVQFEDGTLYETLSGCYDLDMSTASWFRKRENYRSYKANPQSATFGYCYDKSKWILYKETNVSNPCDVEMIAYSAKTYSYDISSSFEEPWYSGSGRPLELYFFDEDNMLTDDQCGSFLGDGNCNKDFNAAETDYDQGDCCAVTCDGPNCGIATMTGAFNTNITSGNGYPNCKNPLMRPITIRLNDVFDPQASPMDNQDFGNDSMETRKPLMILDCDYKNVLTVSIDNTMVNQTETVMVADGATCQMMVKNSTVGNAGIWFVDYTLFHGDNESISSDPIVMKRGNSFNESFISFQRFEDCIFEKLKDHVDKKTIYTSSDPSSRAISWLMKDSHGFSRCERNEFLERYALTTINFAAPLKIDSTTDSLSNNVGLWISTGRHCLWQAVGCNGGIVTELNYEALDAKTASGFIATEIGLLQNLTAISFDGMNLKGDIPSEIGHLTNLRSIHLTKNDINGSIPTEIGHLTDLRNIHIKQNKLSGSIPSEIGTLTSLESLWLWINELTGSVPVEITNLSNLKSLLLDGNRLNGTIPTEVEQLNDLNYIGISYNRISGTIPSELGHMMSLEFAFLDGNDLTGNVPFEIANKTKFNLGVSENKLSGLIPIEGKVICSANESEHYCDCTNHCMVDPPSYIDRCTCQEAQACCDSFRETYTECKICDAGFENPDEYIPAFQQTCFDFQLGVKLNIMEFGIEEKCEAVKKRSEDLGCICRESTQCDVCLNGIQNPDFVVESLFEGKVEGRNCGAIDTFIKQSHAQFGAERECKRAKDEFLSHGCTCNINNLQQSECIVCEFGLENPEFFLEFSPTLEFSQSQCENATKYVKYNAKDYGTKGKCDAVTSSIINAGCVCKKFLSDLEAKTDQSE